MIELTVQSYYAYSDDYSPLPTTIQSVTLHEEERIATFVFQYNATDKQMNPKSMARKGRPVTLIVLYVDFELFKPAS